MSDDILDQARSLFFAEAREMCEQMESSLLRLEADPSDTELLGALFRATHTVKGSAGLFGLDAVVAFTHRVENVLDRLRDGIIALEPALFAVLFESCDMIGTLVDASEDAAAGAAPAVPPALLASLAEYGGEGAAAAGTPAAVAPTGGDAARADTWNIAVQFGADTFRDGFDPFSVLGYLATIGEPGTIRMDASAIPGFADFDPENCHLAFEVGMSGVRGKADIEAAFDLVADSCKVHITPPAAAVESIAERIVTAPPVEARVGEMLVASGAITAGELADALLHQEGSQPGSAPIGEVLVEKRFAPQPLVDAALAKQAAVRNARSDEARFVRVRADKLDELINLVGELVIAGAGTAMQARRCGDPALAESTQSMGDLIEEIRNGALALRMVPIGETFARFRRVVRDVAGELGKDVVLEINGGDTELDKSVVEHIGDPLMHLVRNALDHGMETPDQREAAGKPRTGRVVLSACHEAGGILIRIEDDGRGISRERVLAKARERGLVGATEQPPDADVLNLIFEPGFSTAEQVTNLSGRGVGMDVVRRNIENLRGNVRLESTPGQGTTVEIRLPLTLAIIDGFLVRIDTSHFVIPLEQVVECIEGASTAGLGGSAGVIDLRGAPLPCVRLRGVFGMEGAVPARQSVVVVRNGNERAGLLVDHLEGEFQTVIKPLGRMFRNVRSIAGSTILASGEVGLILDIASLLNMARRADSGQPETATAA